MYATAPDRYVDLVDDDGHAVRTYIAEDPTAFDWIERAILENGFYEKPGVWVLSIDTDKRLMAEIVGRLEPGSALEVGCSSGGVLAGLDAAGVDVCGVDISTFARDRSPDAIRERIRLGELAEMEFDRTYDVTFGLDIFEHIHPGKLDAFIAALVAATTPGGYVLVNVPAYGPDVVFGEAFPISLPEWRGRRRRMAGCSAISKLMSVAIPCTATSCSQRRIGGSPGSKLAGVRRAPTSSARSMRTTTRTSTSTARRANRCMCSRRTATPRALRRARRTDPCDTVARAHRGRCGRRARHGFGVVIFVAALLVFGLACAIAAWFVSREAARLSVEPPPPVFDMEEAYDWVVARVPDDVAATLTPDDVRRILDLQLEFFRRKGVTGNGSSAHPPGEVVVGAAETVDYIIGRAREAGEEYLPEQIYPVVETQLAYLREIGAVGGAAREDESGSG